MSTLTDFLLARIAEDERRARAAADRIPLIYNEAALRDKGIGIAQAGHIARWDPARVLAECDAKRRIVARQPRLSAPDDVRDVWWDLVALLALPYADHPAYRDEWRP